MLDKFHLHHKKKKTKYEFNTEFNVQSTCKKIYLYTEKKCYWVYSISAKSMNITDSN